MDRRSTAIYPYGMARKSDLDRFFENVEFIPFHGCWEWVASKNPNGYGQFSLDGRNCGRNPWKWTTRLRLREA